MKRFFFSLYIIVTLFVLPGNSALSLDNSQGVSKNDFNIVLITIDALRADHLSCYGYHRNTTPHIDKIAEKGIIFKNSIAPSSWTSPSMVSLFTSVYSINHGVIHGFVKNKKIYNQEVFSDELTTLAEILKVNGYSTFAVASNLHLSEKFGFARGFDYFKCLSFHPAPRVNKIIYSWKDEIKKADKFFLWIHYFDPHHFYHSRTPWIEKYTSKTLTQKLKLFEKKMYELLELIPMFKKDPQALSNLIALYDSEINYVDSYVGELIQKLELDKNTLIIITSDHGEGFLEHGTLDHGKNLHSESINIPLIIKLPQRMSKKVIDQQVSLLDIMPTILSMLNIPYPKKIFGEAILTSNGEERNITERFLFTELGKGNYNMKAILTKDWKYIYNYKGMLEELYNRVKNVLTKDWRYIYTYESKIEELYNRKQDSQEQVNLINKKASFGKKFKEQLNQWIASAPRYPAEKIKITPSQEVKEKLKALGYISNGEQKELKQSPKGCKSIPNESQ